MDCTASSRRPTDTSGAHLCEPGVSVPWVGLQELVITEDCLGVPIQIPQADSLVAPSFRQPRVDLQSLVVETDCLPVPI